MTDIQPGGGASGSGRPGRRPQVSLDHYSPAERVTLLRSLYNRVALMWRLFWDERTGFLPKLIPIIALIYLVSPIDILPIWLVGPFAGLDDIGVILAAISMFVQAAPPDVVREIERELGAGGVERDRGDVIDGTAEHIEE